MKLLREENKIVKFEHFKTTATDWAVINYYKIPLSLQFTVVWKHDDKLPHDSGWFVRPPVIEVKQKACQVKVVRRRSDNSFFDVQVLDEEGVTIRGKHCKGISKYIDICNYFIKKG